MKRVISVVAGIVLVATLAACGSDGESAADGAGLAKATVGVMPFVDVAPLYLADEKGIFEKHGLDVTFEQAQGGAAIIPGVVSDKFQFGYSNILSLMLAESKGLGVRMVAPGGFSAVQGTIDAHGGFLVRKDSGIARPADLSGKTVAVNTLNNIADTVTREIVRKDGGDPNDLEFVELPLPDMTAAVDRGQVDAAWSAEPFLTLAESDTVTTAFAPYTTLADTFMPAAYFTSARYAKSDPEVVEKFQAAVAEAAQLAQESPDEARAVMEVYTEIPPAVTKKIVLPEWRGEIDRSSLELIDRLGVKYGLYDEPTDLKVIAP